MFPLSSFCIEKFKNKTQINCSPNRFFSSVWSTDSFIYHEVPMYFYIWCGHYHHYPLDCDLMDCYLDSLIINCSLIFQVAEEIISPKAFLAYHFTLLTDFHFCAIGYGIKKVHIYLNNIWCAKIYMKLETRNINNPNLNLLQIGSRHYFVHVFFIKGGSAIEDLGIRCWA